ncbi:copper homeostasis periplasmic binding protein CopC [Pseudomonas japonica]|uniref:copper homeostasis periplasmic binding protein CopC n=1 Tax=Pseudomonas japonica TaxID=256466 RepID=UPI0015E32B8D|nr:copper homeostasis periplasmic binding protein CopC [Pseudomonas japonica]MBA1244816.1 copper homeostasis periplasmic binding protein CopC [Pseudomonas japonica]
MKLSTALCFVFASTVSSLTWAHAHLQAPSPAEGSTVAAPAELRLTFTEGVEPAFSEVTLTDSTGNSTKAQVHRADNDTVVLVATPATPLHAGSWTVHWKVVSVDTHRSEGQYTFNVK